MLLLFSFKETVLVIGVIEHCVCLHMDFEQNQLLVVTSDVTTDILVNYGCSNIF